MQQVVSVFDNDGTLYNCPVGFETAITERMINFLAKFLCVTEREIRQKREDLFLKYGIRSTLLVFYFEGIIKDKDAFVQETYLAVSPSLYGVKPNFQLKKILEDRFDGNFLVHTNNPSAFAEKIITHLGISDLFDRIFGMFENDYYQKPDARAFKPLLKYISGYKIKRYIDNETPNIITASQLGFETIQVSQAFKENAL